MIAYVTYNPAKHYSAVERLALSLFDSHYHDEIHDVLENGSPDTVLALEQGRVVGFALLNPRTPLGLRGFSSSPNSKFIEIAFLGISPGKQGKGIGSGLLHYVKDLGYAGIWLQVAYDNTDAHRLYTRHGFETWRMYGNKKDGGYMLGWSRERHERLLRLRPRVSLLLDGIVVP